MTPAGADDDLPTPGHPGDLAARIEAAWPHSQWCDTQIGVAVSGGSDSVALLRGLAELKRRRPGRGDLVVLTYDHGSRGGASRADADWVVDLAQRLGLRCHRATSPSDAGAEDHRSEAELRAERRGFFARCADELGLRYVATGHTADDQAETVLFRLFRGSGLRGAAGIRPFDRLTDTCTLVRPLLDETRSELRRSLEALGQDFREDASNELPDYTRNWLRAEVLPLVAGRFPDASGALARFARQAAELDDVIGDLAAELLTRAQASSPSADRIRLDPSVLARQPEVLVREAIRLAWRRAGWPEQAMTAAHWRRLSDAALKSTEAGGHDPRRSFALPGGVEVESTAASIEMRRQA